MITRGQNLNRAGGGGRRRRRGKQKIPVTKFDWITYKFCLLIKHIVPKATK